MPAPLSHNASAKYAALVASSGLTAQIRSLASDIAEACKTPGAMNWSEDLAGISVGIPAAGETRETFGKSLASAFGAVATQTTGQKMGANVRFIDVDTVDKDGKPTGETSTEVAVTFRTVKPRAK